MKKAILVCLILSTLALSVFAQTQNSDNAENDTFTYRTASILKVLNHQDAYVVLYSKGSIGTGQIVIPKKWFTLEAGKKAVLRDLPKTLNPFMTVMYRNGEFDYIILTMPSSYSASCWGVLPPETDISSKLDIETLDIQF